MLKKLMLVALVSLIGLSVNAEVDTIKLTTKNTVILRGPIDGESVQRTQQKLLQLNNIRGRFSNYPIYLVLDSPGGSIYDGLDLIETIKTVKNVQTVTYFSASMAAYTVQATPGQRLVKANGIIMFHRAAGGVSGQFNEGELEQQLNLHKRVVTEMEQINSNRMSISLELYKSKIKDELWIYGKEALSQKAADAVVLVECSVELLESKDVLDIQTFFGPVTVTFSSCPELRNPLSIKFGNSVKNPKEAKASAIKHLTGGYRLK